MSLGHIKIIIDQKIVIISDDLKTQPKYSKFYSRLIHQIDTLKVIKMADEKFYLQLEKAQSKSLTLVLHSWTDDSSEELKVLFSYYRVSHIEMFISKLQKKIKCVRGLTLLLEFY